MHNFSSLFFLNIKKTDALKEFKLCLFYSFMKALFKYSHNILNFFNKRLYKDS